VAVGLPGEEPGFEIDAAAETEPESAQGTSLKARMQRRQQELAARTTELFPVPRYEEFIAVELKAIAWERSEKIFEAHQRTARRMMLNSAADEIVAATVAFHELFDDREPELIEDAYRWSDVCSRFLEVDLPPAPHTTLERIALLTLCSDQGVMGLNAQYRRWLGGANVGISEEVRRDFSTTP
jgi:hypothetical protein